MKVLVATTRSQGAHPGDYCRTVDGELVAPVSVDCCSPHVCGCGRGFPGLGSDRATTTAEVVERPALTRAQLRGAIEDSLERAGLLAELSDTEADEVVEEQLLAIELVCDAFPVGTVLGRWGANVYARPAAAAA